MFGFLKRKPKTFLGVDIGAGGIKMAEFEKYKGRPRLLTYGYSERRPEEVEIDVLNDKKTGEILAKICANAGVKGSRAIAGLPISAIFSSIINIPPSSEKELKMTVELQASKLLPYPLEEAVLDYKILNTEKKDSSKSARVLLTAAPKNLINKYVEIFKNAKLELLYLETEAFGLIRSLIGKDKSTIAILDIGATKTNILIVENGIPAVTKSINLGGLMITKALSEMTKVGIIEAESLKRDARFAENGGAEAGSVLPKPIESLLVPVLNEIRYCFNLYLNENSKETAEGKSAKVEKIVLTGGSAFYPHLADFFSRALNIRVFLGNPWARVLYPEDLKFDLDELGSRFSVAVGLAMREVEENKN
jgi:type IV pilus assembly protein PilM